MRSKPKHPGKKSVGLSIGQQLIGLEQSDGKVVPPPMRSWRRWVQRLCRVLTARSGDEGTMRKIVIQIVGVTLLALLLYGLVHLNTRFGRRVGEVDCCSWYAFETRSGQIYFEPAIDSGNPFVDRH